MSRITYGEVNAYKSVPLSTKRVIQFLHDAPLAGEVRVGIIYEGIETRLPLVNEDVRVPLTYKEFSRKFDVPVDRIGVVIYYNRNKGKHFAVSDLLADSSYNIVITDIDKHLSITVIKVDVSCPAKDTSKIQVFNLSHDMNLLRMDIRLDPNGETVPLKALAFKDGLLEIIPSGTYTIYLYDTSYPGNGGKILGPLVLDFLTSGNYSIYLIGYVNSMELLVKEETDGSCNQ